MEKTARCILISLLVVMIVVVVPWSAIAVTPGVTINKPDNVAKPKTVSLPPPVAPVISLWPTVPSTFKVVINIKYDSPDKTGITGFIVERAQKAGDPRDHGPLIFTKVAQLGPGERSWSETVPEVKGGYYYQVFAVGPTQIRSGPSNQVFYSCLPLPPTNLKAELYGTSPNRSVRITWTSQSKIADQCKVYNSVPSIKNGAAEFLGDVSCSLGTVSFKVEGFQGQNITFWVTSWVSIYNIESWPSDRVSVLIK